MKKSILVLSVAMMASVFASCKKGESTPVTLTLQPGSEGKDAVAWGINPSYNYAVDDRFFVMAGTWSGTPGVTRGYIAFDLASIPATATIQTATLYLTANTEDVGIGGQTNGHNQLSGTNEGYIRLVTSSWAENTLTWNLQPTVTTDGQITIPASTSPSQNYTIDVKSLIQKQVSMPNSYFGLQLALQTEVQYRMLSFMSSDAADASKRPKLVVTYKK